MKLLLLGMLCAGCSHHIYSPPSQAYMLAPVRSLGAGQSTLDIEASQHAQVFDPGILSGAGRLRTGLGDHTEASVEGTVMAVEDSGPSRAARQIYAGRVGIRTAPGGGAVTLFGGLGGGYAPAGGEFVTADGGLQIGYDNCYVVPVASIAGFASKPLDPRPIDVSDSGDGTTSTSTPLPTLGGVFRAGLRISMSPSACRAGRPVNWLTAGFDLTQVADGTASATLAGLGIGIEIPL